jgi:hypothetical protein
MAVLVRHLVASPMPTMISVEHAMSSTNFFLLLFPPPTSPPLRSDGMTDMLASNTSAERLKGLSPFSGTNMKYVLAIFTILMQVIIIVWSAFQPASIGLIILTILMIGLIGWTYFEE